jgi:hypothetical protein
LDDALYVWAVICLEEEVCDLPVRVDCECVYKVVFICCKLRDVGGSMGWCWLFILLFGPSLLKGVGVEIVVKVAVCAYCVGLFCVGTCGFAVACPTCPIVGTVVILARVDVVAFVAYAWSSF